MVCSSWSFGVKGEKIYTHIYMCDTQSCKGQTQLEAQQASIARMISMTRLQYDKHSPFGFYYYYHLLLVSPSFSSVIDF